MMSKSIGAKFCGGVVILFDNNSRSAPNSTDCHVHLWEYLVKHKGQMFWYFGTTAFLQVTSTNANSAQANMAQNMVDIDKQFAFYH